MPASVADTRAPQTDVSRTHLQLVSNYSVEMSSFHLAVVLVMHCFPYDSEVHPFTVDEKREEPAARHRTMPQIFPASPYNRESSTPSFRCRPSRRKSFGMKRARWSSKQYRRCVPDRKQKQAGKFHQNSNPPSENLYLRGISLLSNETSTTFESEIISANHGAESKRKATIVDTDW